MDNILSCNLYSYGRYQEAALPHLVELGIRCVEIGVPALDQVAAVKERFAPYGLTPATVQAPCPCDDPNLAERFDAVFEAANLLGVKVVFVSAKAGDQPLEAVYERLRAVGDKAVAAGVRIAMETHPDLCDNGDKMVATMAALNHPGIGVNFDCANIYYYNEGADAVAEIGKAADHVLSVHLKDTNGGFKTHYFPPLGQGVVDFPAIFARLNARGFHGPFTMELEGIAGHDPDEAGRKDEVAQSVAYLRAQGLVP